MYHVFKMYNTKTENRAIVKVKASTDSRSKAIDEVIKRHAKIARGSWNTPKNWIIEKQIIDENAALQVPETTQPKAKSKQFNQVKTK